MATGPGMATSTGPAEHQPSISMSRDKVLA